MSYDPAETRENPLQEEDSPSEGDAIDRQPDVARRRPAPGAALSTLWWLEEEEPRG